MFEHLERELMEGEPWAIGIVNSPIWNIVNEEQEKPQTSYLITIKILSLINFIYL